MYKKLYFISSMALLIVSTCIGVGILGLPLETGQAGFIPSIVGLILCWLLMGSTGWIMVHRLVVSRETITDMAKVYEKDLGEWAKYLNSASYILTFYGLIVAHLCGAVSIIIHMIPFLRNIPHITTIVNIVYFVIVTAVILYGMETVRKCNIFFISGLLSIFILLIILIIPYTKEINLQHSSWTNFPLQLPILITALGFQVVIPAICKHAMELDMKRMHVFYILLIGITIILVINFVWLFAVIGTLPLTSPDYISIIGAYKEGQPATVPIANMLNSNAITFLAMFFSFFAVTTSYFGLGMGFLNYMRDLTSKYIKSSIYIDATITFIIPLIVSILYPDLFIAILNFVGGFGVIVAFGILPALLAIKQNGSKSLKILGWFCFGLSLIIFFIEFDVMFLS